MSALCCLIMAADRTGRKNQATADVLKSELI